MAKSLVKDVVERHRTSSPQPRVLKGFDSSLKTGFPEVQHRSRRTSAFKQTRLDQRIQAESSVSKPQIKHTSTLSAEITDLEARDETQNGAEDWMKDISRSNAETVERMSEEERQRERDEIIERFGAGIHDLMKGAREARERRTLQPSTEIHKLMPDALDSSAVPASYSLPPSPRTRSTRKIRFVEPTEADIHVYQSEPSSPRRPLALLPPPPKDSHKLTDISSFGSLKGQLSPPKTLQVLTHPVDGTAVDEMKSLEEGTPEHIRRRYFPSEVPAAQNPALVWMLPSSTSPTPSGVNHLEAEQSGVFSSEEARYSLSGFRLSPSQISNLPTHLGLHHHGSTASSSPSDTLAGYTLSDLLLLARSSVPAQRASILGVLARILRVSREHASAHQQCEESRFLATSSTNDVDLDAMRRDVLDAAIDALGEKGGVGQRAMDVLWEVIVGFIQGEFGISNLEEFPHVELTPISLPISTPTHALPGLHGTLNTKGAGFPLSSVSILAALPLPRILPALKMHLLTFPSPLSLTHSQILDILFVLSHYAQHARTIVDPVAGAGIISAMLGPHFQSGSGVEEACATTASIRILQVLACNGRDIATILTGPADVLLRYMMTPLPVLNHDQWQSHRHIPSRLILGLLEETLRFYTLLAQYGLYSQVATTAQDYFATIGAWLTTNLLAIPSPIFVSLAAAYLGLLEVLIVCATDPHRTTPSHDILWSQVRGWAWANWTLDFADVVAAVSGSVSLSLPSGPDSVVALKHDVQGLWAHICHTTAAWLEGASVNDVGGGEEEKTLAVARLGRFFDSGGAAELMLHAAVAYLRVWQFSSSSDTSQSLRALANTANLLAGATRLALACSDGRGVRPPLKLPRQDIHEVCMGFLGNDTARGLFDFASGKRDRENVLEDAHNFTRPVCMLLVLELRSWRRSFGESAEEDLITLNEEWNTRALGILRVLLPGDEDFAEQIFELLCESINSGFVQRVLSSTDVSDEHWNEHNMRILLPFLIHSLRNQAYICGENPQSPSVYVAPLSSTPKSIAHCTTLILPSLTRLRGSRNLHDGPILPMRNDWPTWPLNHLLRSGSSPVFRNLPSDWNATEIDVVRASLLLTRIDQALEGRRKSVITSYGMSRAETVFACMKVFMLEHGQQLLDSGDEVFRDPFVMRSMDELLTPFTYVNTQSHHEVEVQRDWPLEQISKKFLGPDVPFFQFYTDFLALYDAISFSHPLFGRLLLPPTSMSYAMDYRKLLYGDYGHVLRTIQTSAHEILCEDVREFLWPVEKNGQMLGWYLKALITSPVRGFVRWVAVHHIASNIWPGLRDEDSDSLERASKLLNAMVGQGSVDVVKDVALYRQPKAEVWMPPRCYEHSGSVSAERRLVVECIGDQRVKEHLLSLFVDTSIK